MLKWFFLFILCTGLGLFGYLFFYLGAFKPVTIDLQTYPEMHLIFQDNIGPYHHINEKLDFIEKKLNGMGFHCNKTFGEFLDDPNMVDPDRLRSRVGCVIDKPSPENLSDLPDSLLYRQVVSRPIIFARFDGSPAIGPVKVYPNVEEFAQKQRKQIVPPVMELYTVRRNGRVITEYLFNLAAPETE